VTYLLQHATRRLRSSRDARVDENVRLNLPGFYGDAYVRVFVGDTSFVRARRRRLPEPRIRLRVADCDNTISLWFSVDSPGERENALFKIDTLLASLHRFRDALADEVELRAERERRKELACRT
jgi:hypothetical protein